MRALLLLVPACLSLSGCLGASCSNVLFVQRNDVEITTFTDAQGLAFATFTFCINDRCSSGEVPRLPISGGKSAGGLAGAVQVGSEVANTAHGIVLHAVVTDTNLQDGDVYTASITSTEGVTLAWMQWRATYHTHWPDGEECGQHVEQVTLTPT